MSRKRLGVTAAALLAAAVPALAQPRPGAAELPVSRIVLFSSGVGYFQRDGQVEGSARIDLQFHTHNINDLLKSLILQDQGGGQVSTVHYDNRDPIDKTLKSFAIDLTANPTLGDLLNQVRGERVEVVSYGEQGKEGQAVNVTGLVVGVQKIKKPHGPTQLVDTEQLNLLTTDGLQGVTLNQVQRVRLLKPELEQEFRKALEVLAAGHDKQKKTVSLNFLGNGKRTVKVGYVTEAPIWKTSYRLSLDNEAKGNKATLQGWAVVENTTDEDWSNVRLGLVSGRPISFQMDLYQPLYVPRPMVEPELFASLRPQTYSGDMLRDNALGNQFVPGQQQQVIGGAGGMGGAMLGRRAGADAGGRAMREAGEVMKRLEKVPAEAKALANMAATSREELIRLGESVVSAAVATELGEYFQYELEQPVSLPRQKSALLPIVNGPVEATKVSIFNESVHNKFPLHGLRFRNTTGLHLMQGPVTVFEGGTYVGDARSTDLQPNETRLLSYAVDLGTEVTAEEPNPAETLTAVKVYKGAMYNTHKVRFTKRYTVKNRGEHERLVLVEHPYQAHRTLVTPEKASERTRDVYRFEVKAAPKKPVTVEVVEEERRTQAVALTNSDDEAVRILLRANVITPQVKEALQKAMDLKRQVADARAALQKEEADLKATESDQARVRANLEKIPQTSEAYKRFLKKLEDQESEIEQRRTRIEKLRDASEQKRKEYEQFLMNLNVE